MNKYRLVCVLAICVTLLSGCSIVSEVNNTIDYVSEATKLITNAQSFSEQFPSMVEQAVLSEEARQTLVTQLEQLREDITNFNGIDVPAVANDIHRELVGYNEKLIGEIDTYLGKINDGITELEQLRGAEILDTISRMTLLLQQFEQLGG
ncbi:DUF6376 family protein [Paenibacillus alkalitolerans]|uniref:DUF6376 family protein n=1 Tax=Paenibacillus alkalitolerans TaxID=2799335 RepID=UPI0018F38649|nr:DUF6376 family protein [Paenibacillus alkalitolerans]